MCMFYVINLFILNYYLLLIFSIIIIIIVISGFLIRMPLKINPVWNQWNECSNQSCECTAMLRL